MRDRLEADRSYTDFVRAQHATLSRMAVMLTGGRGGADDLLQDTLLKTYGAWGRIQPETALAYARRVMTNLATDRWRRRR